MRRLIGIAAAAVAALGGGFAAVSATTSPEDPVAVSSIDECQKANVHPDSGRIELRYLRPSIQNAGHADYLLTMTLRWDSDAALSCFDDGIKDWAYEHDVLYKSTSFDRKVWNEDYSSFPSEAGAYTDTDKANTSDATSLSFGIFRPERLKAGTTYRASYEMLLPSSPRGGKHPLTLEGEILEKACNEVGPWCVGLDQRAAARARHTFVGSIRGGLAATGDCWDWKRGSDPVRCDAPPGPTTTEPAERLTTSPPPLRSPLTTVERGTPSTSAPDLSTTAPPALTTTSPPSPPPPSPPSTAAPPPPAPKTRTLTIDNRVTNGATQMREDTPAYLSTVTHNFCKSDGCMLANTDVLDSGDRVNAYCQTSGDRTTNGQDNSSIDDQNPALFESRRWYGIRWADGRTGYISEVWIAAGDRGGVGLPAC